jgi:prepilin signal peptidase PulO-like enzyme (type II secretory pathway)
MLLTILIFFILGLIIGSFLNVVVYRLNLAESILGRSYCPHCKGKIRWYDNIPLLSFIVLKFQCRNCKKKISWQYPLVEFFTGIAFAAVGANYFNAADAAAWMMTLYYLGIISFLIAIFIYDFLYLEIPGLVLWPAVTWTIAFNLFFDLNRASFGNDALSSSLFSGVLAGFVAFAFFFLLSALSKEKWMGMGDAYLAILLGLILGWPAILLGLFLAFAIGASVGITLVILGRKKIKSQLPFAPFLVFGTILALFFYDSIISWYLGRLYM